MSIQFGSIISDFLVDFHSQVAVIGGATGTGKSYALGQKLLMAATFQRAWRGIRKTHFLIARPSAGDVKESLVKDLEDEILSPIKEAGGVVNFVGQYPIKGDVKFMLPDGTEVHCEITAMGLEDQASAKKKLKSKKYTCAFVPEMQTMWNQGVIDEVIQRVNRFPTDKDGGIVWEIPMSDGSIVSYTGGRLWGDMNYTDMRHWFYEYIVSNNILKEDGEPTRKFYELPSVLIAVPDANSNFTYKGEQVRFEGNPEALPYIKHAVLRDAEGNKIPGSEFNHWLNQVEQMVGDDAQIDENIMGVWGHRTEGKPVYPRFSITEQVAKIELHPNVTRPVYVGVDGGFNNAFVFGQESHTGKLAILDAINNVGDDAKSIGEALDTDVLPLLNLKYMGCEVVFVVDPSMFFGEGSSGRTQVDEFWDRNLKVVQAPTQNPGERLKDGGWFVDTRGVLEISANAKEVVTALAGGYNYRLKRDGMFDEHPDKKSRYSHIGDAYQYLCSQLKRGFSRKSKKGVSKTKRRSYHRW